MAVTLWMMLLCLLMHGSFCINEHIERGCLKWSLDKTDENNVCCDVCRPGNHLVKPCGPSPEELCTPCKPNRFMVQPNSLKCSQCTQCVGMCADPSRKCTPTRDTVCGCKEGLMCGDDQCSFCVTACVNGTFYDQMQQRCKPWSTRCRNPDQVIVAKGDAFSDIKCEDATASADYVDTLVWALLPGMVILLLLLIIFSVTLKLQQEKKLEKTKLETPVIGTPTDNDDHMTLIAIECSFHEAEQEQGSSLESLVSENSTKELIE
eukprot:XP_011601029.1 PREDICTED: tumor necrosis factor receptor superfamily member 4-like [Takifugu rubripes]